MNERRQRALLTYLKGQPGDKDLEVIDKWKQENPRELEEYVEVWNKSGMLNDQIEVDAHQAWMMVLQQVDNKKAFKFNWLRVAAVISLLITAGLLMYQFLQRDQFTTTNQTQQIALKDNSKVYLNTNSQLRIIDFNERKRALSLKGEAYFEVARDESRPFIVETHWGTVQVLGTQFNTLATDSNLVVSVASGLVQVSTENESEILKAGESVLVSAGKFRREPNNQNFLAWQNGVLKFTNNTGDHVLATLSKHFEVNFKNKQLLSGCKLTATYDNLSLLQILEELELIWQVKFKVKDQLVEISGEGCKKGGV